MWNLNNNICFIGALDSTGWNVANHTYEHDCVIDRLREMKL